MVFIDLSMLGDTTKIVDLSNSINEEMPVWPSFSSVRCEQTDWAARDGFTMEEVSMTTHTGTHIDAPLHFIPEGKTLNEFPLETFMGEGVAIDLTPKEPRDPITVNDLEPFESKISNGDVVVLHTNWNRYYGRTPEWLFEYPFLTGDAAEYLVSLEPKAVGIDTPSVGGWDDKVPNHEPVTEIGSDESHLPLLENDIIPIEELRNLEQVLDGKRTQRAYFFFPPLNYHGTSGSSVRAYAFV